MKYGRFGSRPSGHNPCDPLRRGRLSWENKRPLHVPILNGVHRNVD
jgi:hypothetical protein